MKYWANKLLFEANLNRRCTKTFLNIKRDLGMRSSLSIGYDTISYDFIFTSAKEVMILVQFLCSFVQQVFGKGLLALFLMKRSEVWAEKEPTTFWRKA